MTDDLRPALPAGWRLVILPQTNSRYYAELWHSGVLVFTEKGYRDKPAAEFALRLELQKYLRKRGIDWPPGTRAADGTSGWPPRHFQRC